MKVSVQWVALQMECLNKRCGMRQSIAAFSFTTHTCTHAHRQTHACRQNTHTHTHSVLGCSQWPGVQNTDTATAQRQLDRGNVMNSCSSSWGGQPPDCHSCILASLLVVPVQCSWCGLILAEMCPAQWATLCGLPSFREMWFIHTWNARPRSHQRMYFRQYQASASAMLGCPKVKNTVLCKMNCALLPLLVAACTNNQSVSYEKEDTYSRYEYQDQWQQPTRGLTDSSCLLSECCK